MSRRKLLSKEETLNLIPGLPNCIVLDCILPRLPWHTRPRMKALSKAWQSALKRPDSYSAITRKTAHIEGLVVAHQLSQDQGNDYFKHAKIQRWMPHPHALSIYNDEAKQWKQLPPIPAVKPLRILHDCGIACVDGRLFVMGGWDPKTDNFSSEVYMLDLGSGLWEWEKRCSMHTAKAFFYCKSIAEKIYVVGGSSTQSRKDEEPLPEVYDSNRNQWDLLPKVTVSRSFHYTGLAASSYEVLAYGFCTSERGELVNFWRVYDPHAKQWRDWNFDSSRCSNLLAGDHDLRDGIVNRLDTAKKSWTPFEGKVCTKTWRWEGHKKVMSDSTCAHSFFVVTESSRPHVYATICEGDNRCLTIWRGDMDYNSKRVAWAQLELPGSLSMCSEMCYVHS
eukprot:c18740_g1_i1 orf=340-1515(-)